MKTPSIASNSGTTTTAGSSFVPKMPSPEPKTTKAETFALPSSTGTASESPLLRRNYWRRTARVCEVLHSLEPTTYLEVGSGPGTYTSILPGKGIALDQSAAALRVLLSRESGVPVIRADALQLPLRDRCVGRVFAAHIYGILAEPGRTALLQEARRVGSQIIVLDSGRPAGVSAEEWQQRTSGLDRRVYRVLRRHFDAHELADEIGGRVLFAGRFYVVVISET